MAKTNIEIAICTWNRAELLRKTLDNLKNVSHKWREVANWRVIFVDNNSTDQTKSVADQFKNLIELEYVFEPKQGHVFARNKAIDVAQGDLILWTDDDVLVDENWLPAYVAASISQPDYSFWGSKIVPTFLAVRPQWVQDNWSKVKGCFAERDLGNSSFSFDYDTFAIRCQFRDPNRNSKKPPVQSFAWS